MSVTSGFFNSLNHDRRYNAQQMSSIFDGVINDGVFANIGVAFKATAAGGVTVNIGEGKAWFNSAWVQNDTVLPLTFEASEVVLDRIDAIVIDVDHNEPVRSGDIKIVKGTPSSSPKRPTMVSDKKHKQAPLVYIYRKAGSTEITQADITNMVGTSECPYITGILQVQNIDNIVAQWNAQWNQWYAAKTAETNSDASELLAEMKSEFDIWFAYIQALMSEKIVEADSDTSELLAKMKSEFDSWFDDFKTVLDDDAATSLAAKVADLMAKFDTLAKEGAVYDEIEDSDLDEILGSDGTPIQGKTVIGSGTGGSADLSEPMSGDIDMNGYRVMNVADPEQDDDAANAGYVKMVASKASTPRNLLDNSDFRNPVMRNGFNGTPGAMGYIINRWYDRYGFGVFTQTDKGITIEYGENHAYFNQHVRCYEKLNNKKMTLAVCDYGGNVHIASGVYNTSASPILGKLDDTFTFSLSRDGTVSCTVLSGSIGLQWAALYEGEYTIDTLPEYQPKGYENELLVCSQYDSHTDEYIGLRKFGYAHNLLDNSDFRNPVNQRGMTSFVANDSIYQYFIDRWCFVDWSGKDDGTLTLTDNGISVTKEKAYFYQRHPLKNIDTTKVHTFAIYYADGTIEISKANSGLHTVYTKPEYIEVRFIVEVGKTVSKVALYEGEYTIDTLPEYQPKGYGAELAECQRYYIKIEGAIAYGVATVNNTAEIVLPIPTTMRVRYPNYDIKNGIWAYKPDGSVSSISVIGVIATAGSVKISGTTENSSNVCISVPDVSLELFADL